jgi:hypothetical protein
MGVLLLGLVACESGTYRSLTVELPEAVTSAHDEARPGVLVSDLWPGRALHALCGQREGKALTFAEDELFSCMPDDTKQLVRVWVEPAPTGWTAEELCAAAPGDRLGLVYGGERTVVDTSDTSDTGLAEQEGRAPELVLAEAPEPGWSQGSAMGEWSRDGSPCGGRIEVSVTVSPGG